MPEREQGFDTFPFSDPQQMDVSPHQKDYVDALFARFPKFSKKNDVELGQRITTLRNQISTLEKTEDLKTSEELKELYRQLQSVTTELAMTHWRLVHYAINRLPGSRFFTEQEKEDLFQVGFEKLRSVAYTYQPFSDSLPIEERSVATAAAFSTLAVTAVKRSLKRYEAEFVTVSTNSQAMNIYYNYRKVEEKLFQLYHLLPTLSMLAAYIVLSETSDSEPTLAELELLIRSRNDRSNKLANRMRKHRQKFIELKNTVSTHFFEDHIQKRYRDENREVYFYEAERGDKSADPAPSLEQSITNQELGEALESIYRSLNERERIILDLYFGLHGSEEHTEREISAFLGISLTRVFQLVSRALGKFRRHRAYVLLEEWVTKKNQKDGSPTYRLNL